MRFSKCPIRIGHDSSKEKTQWLEIFSLPRTAALSPIPTPRYLRKYYHREEMHISTTTRHFEELTNDEWNLHIRKRVQRIVFSLSLPVVLRVNFGSACEFET